MHALADENTLVLLCGAVGPKIIDAFNARVDHYFTRSIVDTKAVDTVSTTHCNLCTALCTTTLQC
jgi:hypothetical protein